MEIISHRGYWVKNSEKNLEVAFRRSFELGFGTETDLRDYGGEVVISHDMPCGNDIMTFEEFIRIYISYEICSALALNVKSDGLQIPVKSILEKYSVDNYFMFDMSIPDFLQYKKNHLKSFARISEYETITPEMQNLMDGVWFDYFNNDELDHDSLKHILKYNKQVCLVSPELHKKNHFKFWDKLKQEKLHLNNKLIICTDIPEEAMSFFKD
ncbi:hypothetical protein [Halobacteriovorax sp. DPLXC-1]|uniref:hypothetical protein n=1 Tax=Halobacteriovorax sp. DPLXC-1 TaxID=3110771 RepID=UPI002FF36B9E